MRVLFLLYIILASIGIFLVYGLANYLLISSAKIISKETNQTLSRFEYSIITSKVGQRPVLLIKSYSKTSLNASCMKVNVDGMVVDSEYKIVNGDSDNLFEKDETLIVELGSSVESGVHKVKVLFCNGEINDIVTI